MGTPPRVPGRRRASTLPPNAPPELRIARLERRNAKLTALLEVAKAMTAERNLDALLDLILREAVRTVDAERGSLFITSRDGSRLWSRLAHGHSDRIELPMGAGIAGHVARTGEILSIPDAYADPRFDPRFDAASGFRTASILCVPMLGQSARVVGVVQALNHSPGPFTEDDEELLLALGANAAAAIENANLYDDIQRLFEGFVEASVTAIESRDPTTSGHSHRVASLCVGMLDVLPRAGGRFAELSFDEHDRRELRYAALLHDFGKVGVRENVLLKAAKLYPHELDALEARFEQARRSHQVRLLELRVRALEEAADTPERLRERLEREWQQVDEELLAMLDFVRRCNQPTVLESSGFERLSTLAELSYVDLGGYERRLLGSSELENLSIARGSLNEEERREIESHVSHTFNFLMRIPWTSDLERIPEFAHGHHEKLDGSGYPRGLRGDAIPLQTRIMTIADIYDALTAADRPYKSAMPHARAVAILESEVARGKLDGELLRVFVEADVARRVDESPSS